MPDTTPSSDEASAWPYTHTPHRPARCYTPAHDTPLHPHTHALGLAPSPGAPVRHGVAHLQVPVVAACAGSLEPPPRHHGADTGVHPRPHPGVSAAPVHDDGAAAGGAADGLPADHDAARVQGRGVRQDRHFPPSSQLPCLPFPRDGWMLPLPPSRGNGNGALRCVAPLAVIGAGTVADLDGRCCCWCCSLPCVAAEPSTVTTTDAVITSCDFVGLFFDGAGRVDGGCVRGWVGAGPRPLPLQSCTSSDCFPSIPPGWVLQRSHVVASSAPAAGNTALTSHVPPFRDTASPAAAEGRLHQTVAEVQQADSSGAGAGGTVLLGWFSYRPGAGLCPTMREGAVCAALLRASGAGAGQGPRSGQGAGQGQPVIFGALTTSSDHGGATLSVQYR